MAAAKKKAAGKQLVSTVYVEGKAYGPDDDVPAEVAEQITNPKAWGEAGDDKSDADADDADAE